VARRPGHDGRAASPTKSLGKALRLLELVAAAEHPPTVAELAQMAGLTRPTTYRLVQTLAAASFVRADALDGRLSIGLGVLPLAASLLDRNRLRIEALPQLQALAVRTGERVNLGILHDDRVLLLAGAEKPSLPTIYSRFGRLVPVHCCAMGKAILAFLPTEEVRAIVAAHPMVPHTTNTITSLPALLSELEATRARGYAIEQGEHMPGSCCIAAAVLDANARAIGAISISGRALEPLIADIAHLSRTAEMVSHLL
jgi:DNA-binding IclR family transcriptional regulator